MVRAEGREEFLPLTKSLGMVSGGRLATSVSSPNMEDGSGVVDDEDEHRAARGMDELVGMELRRRRRSRAEDQERAMAAAAVGRGAAVHNGCCWAAGSIWSCRPASLGLWSCSEFIAFLCLRQKAWNRTRCRTDCMMAYIVSNIIGPFLKTKIFPIVNRVMIKYTQIICLLPSFLIGETCSERQILISSSNIYRLTFLYQF
jgi:hypothetical protein